MLADDYGRDFNVYGQAIVDYGLALTDATDGVGLLTRGNIWQLPQIWFAPILANPISTSWSTASHPTTTWSTASHPTTNWTVDQGGFWGGN